MGRSRLAGHRCAHLSTSATDASNAAASPRGLVAIQRVLVEVVDIDVWPFDSTVIDGAVSPLNRAWRDRELVVGDPAAPAENDAVRPRVIAVLPGLKVWASAGRAICCCDGGIALFLRIGVGTLLVSWKV
jgi:hypothetical protein